MFGLTLSITIDGRTVILRAPTPEDLPAIALGMSSLSVVQYTQQLFAKTIKQEEDWFSSKAKSEDEVTWLITVPEEKQPIGVTGLHHLDLNGSCASGIIIWNKDWWGKGVASRSHLGRTLYAADYLNRNTIRSAARVVNKGSVNALKRIGYHVIGIEPRTAYRHGKFIDSYLFVWFNPDRRTLLFGDKVPKRYQPALQRAEESLNLARKVVSF